MSPCMGYRAPKLCNKCPRLATLTQDRHPERLEWITLKLDKKSKSCLYFTSEAHK